MNFIGNARFDGGNINFVGPVRPGWTDTRTAVTSFPAIPRERLRKFGPGEFNDEIERLSDEGIIGVYEPDPQRDENGMYIAPNLAPVHVWSGCPYACLGGISKDLIRKIR